ncbi:carbohydrate ABC transporter permease [Lactococcus cremoris]|uniref:Sugar transport system permease protein n=1 Tax=Lactococcus cremoris subsp. cremoris GE214 TaxID=1415168 RepID=A0A084AEB6_LACLC|nr:sugar ABC transporter permease [Lactococcus cremoris]KEY63645.1 Sugar transport system permease protein [Lactococcus cremoris subsp. cremoris GE214]
MEKQKTSKRARGEMFQAYGFLAPALLVILIFFVLSILFAVYLSFNNVNLIAHNYQWNNFKNYTNLLGDKQLFRALENTGFFALVVVPVQTIIALVIAYILANKGIKGKTLFRLIYFLPTLTSSAALTLIFMFIFNLNGPINGLLESLHLISQPINFINDTNWTLKVIMIMNIWSTVPYFMTIYLASLVDLPDSMYEAAEIDGANVFDKLRYITIPYLRPITTFVLLTGIIGTFQMFDQAYIFSRGTGGPANSTLTVSLLIFQYAFGQNNQMGYAAVIAIILAIIIFIVARIAEKLNGGNGFEKN